jgi:diaminopimelate decarboxylase
MFIPPKIRAHAAEAPSPCYIYDLSRLRQRLAMVLGLGIPHTQIFFATMANDHPAILATVRDAGAGVFVNSPSHLRLVLDLGFSPDRIVFAASNMITEELKLCIEKGVHLVLDSIGQIEAFGLAGGKRCSLRINVGSVAPNGDVVVDPIYRFGILPEEIDAALEVATNHGVTLVGAHCYFGTDIMEPKTLIQGLEALCLLAEQLPDLELIDAGGGFGVPDRVGESEFDLECYRAGAAAAIESLRARLGRPVKLFIEPGRYLSADCAFFVVTVVDEKRRSDRVFVGVDASTTVFPRPLLYPETGVHHCEPLAIDNQPSDNLPAFVCGNSTYSRDFFGRQICLPRLRRGERLIFHNAGAYCRSMITKFLGKEQPTELFLDTEADVGEEMQPAALAK